MFDEVVSTIRLMDSACHVMGCHLTQDTRVPNVFDDVWHSLFMSTYRHVAAAVICALAVVVNHVITQPDFRNAFHHFAIHQGLTLVPIPLHSFLFRAQLEPFGC